MTNGSLRTMLLEMNWQEHITADPNILAGKPILRGTRLSVEFILGLLTQGWPESEIIRNYRISPESIRACFAFAQDHASR